MIPQRRESGRGGGVNFSWRRGVILSRADGEGSLGRIRWHEVGDSSPSARLRMTRLTRRSLPSRGIPLMQLFHLFTMNLVEVEAHGIGETNKHEKDVADL